jgi:hypothetical protein
VGKIEFNIKRRRNTMGIADIFTTNDENKDKLDWGEAYNLWSIARFKILGLTILDIFSSQAKDEDLKDAINKGVENIILPHLEKIKKIMYAYGAEAPAVPQRKNLDTIAKNIEPNSYINDIEIAHDLREVFRYGLELDLKAAVDSTKDDAVKLAWNILEDDFKAFTTMVKLFNKKNWSTPPPSIS